MGRKAIAPAVGQEAKSEIFIVYTSYVKAVLSARMDKSSETEHAADVSWGFHLGQRTRTDGNYNRHCGESGMRGMRLLLIFLRHPQPSNTVSVRNKLSSKLVDSFKISKKNPI